MDIEDVVAAAIERMGGDAGDAAHWRRRLWERTGYAFVAEMTPDVAAALFDIAVEMGAPAATRMLQRAINAFNRDQKDHADLRVDGIVGARTLQAVGAYRRVRGARGEPILLRAIEALRGERCIALAGRRPSRQGPLYEWLMRDSRARADDNIVCT